MSPEYAFRVSMLQTVIEEQDRAEAACGETVLVVDDSRMQRRILSLSLRKHGFEVVEASTAQEGLAAVATHQIDLVISAWVIPGMTGPDFCRALRALDRDQYLYIILLTTKTETSAIADGLEAGADDFLSKPVNGTELAARLHAAQRLLTVERQLTEKNRIINATLSELRTVYDALDRDLIEARELQQSLVMTSGGTFGAAEVSLLLQPSGHVGGDLVGFFEPNPHELGIFALDVSGHGVSSAMMTARLHGLLSGSTPGQNIAIERDGAGTVVARDPADVAGDLNTLLLTEMKTQHYFTLFLVIVELVSGRFRAVQAGHPAALVIDGSGASREIGDGGMPIGLIEGAPYESFTGTLAAGDRLILASDGLSECENAAGEMLDTGGIAEIARSANDSATAELPAILRDRVEDFAGGAEFADDVSVIVIDYGR